MNPTPASNAVPIVPTLDGLVNLAVISSRRERNILSFNVGTDALFATVQESDESVDRTTAGVTNQEMSFDIAVGTTPYLPTTQS